MKKAGGNFSKIKAFDRAIQLIKNDQKPIS